MMNSEIGVSLFLLVAAPPPVAKDANDQEGSQCEVEDTVIQPFCRAFTQLLRRFCTEGTLRHRGNAAQ